MASKTDIRPRRTASPKAGPPARAAGQRHRVIVVRDHLPDGHGRRGWCWFALAAALREKTSGAEAWLYSSRK